MTNEERPIEIGDRFKSKDPRDEGRVVQVREIRDAGYESGMFGRVADRYQVENEVHPNNPEAVGRRSVISGRTLRRSWERISR